MKKTLFFLAFAAVAALWTVSGAKPHGQVDEVMPSIELVSALPTSNWEPTLSAELRIRRQANLTTIFGFAFGELRNFAPVSRFVTAFHSIAILNLSFQS